MLFVAVLICILVNNAHTQAPEPLPNPEPAPTPEHCSTPKDCPNTDEKCSRSCGSGLCTDGLNCTNDARKHHCEPTRHVCLECLNNTQCQGTLTCSSGTCVCSANKDCYILDKKLCKSGVCYDCLVSSDCRNDTHCNANCVTSTCSASTLDCAVNGKYCNAKTIQCVDCITDDNCVKNNDTKAYCSANNVCVECLDNINCPHEKPFCFSGTCVACIEDNECRNDSHCNSYCNHLNECFAGDENCTSNVDQNMCNVENGKCVQCLTVKNCPKDRKYCSDKGLCIECLSNLDCEDYIMNTCSPEGMCVECLNNTMCRTNDTCDATCQNYNCVLGVNNCTATIEDDECDIVTGECHECLSSIDCERKAPDSRPYCSPNSFQCVECLTPDNCRNDSNCNPTCNDYCSIGSLNCTATPDKPRCLVDNGYIDCVQCLSNKDCHAPTTICQDNICIECINDDGCPSSKPMCIDSVCRPCRINEDCRNPQSCDATCFNNQCVKGKLNCYNQNKNFCDKTTGKCLQCRYDSDCGKNPDGSTGYCKDNHCVQCQGNNHFQCRSDINCNATCRNDRCEFGGLVCPSHCDVNTGICVECGYDGHCKDPTKPYCDLRFFKCMACYQNTHCKDNQNCRAECIRATENTMAYCKSETGTNCTKIGQFCDPVKTTCVECLSNDHCNSISACFDNECGLSFQKTWWMLMVGGLGLLLFIIGFSCIFIVKYNRSQVDYQTLDDINDIDEDEEIN